jgi:hypothetical protein
MKNAAPRGLFVSFEAAGSITSPVNEKLAAHAVF